VSVARFGVSAHEQKNEPTGGSCEYDRHFKFPLEFGCVASVGRLSRPSHPLGDFEDQPAKSGEAQAPKKHHNDHR
jgi:hypothetical protein